MGEPAVVVALRVVVEAGAEGDGRGALQRAAAVDGQHCPVGVPVDVAALDLTGQGAVNVQPVQQWALR